MKERRVVLAPEAADNLGTVYNRLARRVSLVAFKVDQDTVTVRRVRTFGRDWESAH